MRIRKWILVGTYNRSDGTSKMLSTDRYLFRDLAIESGAYLTRRVQGMTYAVHHWSVAPQEVKDHVNSPVIPVYGPKKKGQNDDA